MTDRRPWLIMAGGVLLAALIIVGALIVGGRDSETSAAPADTARVLPDGSTATAAQDAYLDAVEPSLTSDHAADVLTVLSSGESLCTVWLHPSDPAIQVQAVELLMTASSYNQTEATVIARAASEHLCPGK